MINTAATTNLNDMLDDAAKTSQSVVVVYKRELEILSSFSWHLISEAHERVTGATHFALRCKLIDEAQHEKLRATIEAQQLHYCSQLVRDEIPKTESNTISA